MDQSEVKRIVEANLATYLKAFGIAHWKIKVVYDHELDSCGECSLQPEYDQARITLNYADLEDEKMVLFCLRHELLHVVNAPQKVFCDQVAAYFNESRENDAAANMLMKMYAYTNERTVKNLERMYEGLCEMQVTKGEHAPASMS